MRHQSGEGKTRRKSRKTNRTERVLSAVDRHLTIDPLEFDIDPGEFFDPEEFGFRRSAQPLGR